MKLPAKILRAIIPISVEWAIKRTLFRGRNRVCPICRATVRRFLSYGHRRRPDACCPVCKSVERHRMVWLFLERRSDLFAGRKLRMLHIAPEQSIEFRLRRCRHLDYITADLMDSGVTVQMDLCAIPFPDASFDVIYCSDVLEHVPDDCLAMRELRRVLRPDGWAVLMVPIKGDRTDEDLDLVDPDERARRFGQPDHVRMYGLDFVERLERSGFCVDVVRANSFVSPDELDRMQIAAEDPVFHCTRGPYDPATVDVDRGPEDAIGFGSTVSCR